jgi:uncharacterized membrane protein
MRRFAGILSLFAFVCAAFAVHAQEKTRDIKGIFLMTDYPAISVRAGSTSTISLKLQNYGAAPERFALDVGGIPNGWTATLLGGGQPVAAAMPSTDSNVSLQLRLDVPADAGDGSHTLTVDARGQSINASLPITVTLAKELPAKLKVEPKLPALRGSAKSSFEYQLTIKNDSGRNLLASFAAAAPQNFETSFTEAYGSQELSSIPIEAGQSKDIKLKVRPPSTIDAGHYPVKVTVTAEDTSAQTEVALDIVGQPQLRVSGRDGLVSARAEAGVQSSVPVIVTNIGSAPAEDIELSSSAPNGWKVEFDPKTIDRLAPGARKEVTAQVTPVSKALAGDYMTTVRANSRSENASTDFRVTVSTSTLWGITGVGIVAVALLIMVGAVARFGRR